MSRFGLVDAGHRVLVVDQASPLATVWAECPHMERAVVIRDGLNERAAAGLLPETVQHDDGGPF